MKFAWKKLATPVIVGTPSGTTHRPRRIAFSWDALEERTVLSHMGGFHHRHDGASSEVASTSTTGSNTALATAQQALRTAVQTIESASGTTVGQLTAIHTTFQTLRTDGLSPTSRTALATFEDSLVKTFASGTAVIDNAALLTQFEALYTATPPTTQVADLTAAYKALATAVTSANITTSNLQTIDAAWTAVQTARGDTTATTYPYFSLVTGGHGGFGGGGGRGGCH